MRGGGEGRGGEPAPTDCGEEEDADGPRALAEANRLSAVDERGEEKQQDGDARQHHAADDFERPVEVLQHLKQEEEVPLGTGDEGNVGGVGEFAEGDANRDGEDEQHREGDEDGDGVLKDLTGVELDGRSGFHRGWRDAVAANQIDVEEEQQRSEGGKDEHVSAVEAGEGDSTDLAVLAAEKRQNIRAHHGSFGGDLRGDHGAPVRPVVPRQKVAG